MHSNRQNENKYLQIYNDFLKLTNTQTSLISTYFQQTFLAQLDIYPASLKHEN